MRKLCELLYLSTIVLHCFVILTLSLNKLSFLATYIYHIHKRTHTLTQRCLCLCARVYMLYCVCRVRMCVCTCVYSLFCLACAYVCDTQAPIYVSPVCHVLICAYQIQFIIQESFQFQGSSFLQYQKLSFTYCLSYFNIRYTMLYCRQNVYFGHLSYLILKIHFNVLSNTTPSPFSVDLCNTHPS